MACRSRALIDRILAESGYEAALIGEFLGDRKRANARKLVRMARRFDEQGGFTLADFVGRLRADLRGATKETQAATTDEEGEIIRLMSIHQAKGLEFPIVVLPDLDRKRPGELKRVAFDADLGPLVNPVVDPSIGEDGDESESGNCLGWTLHRHSRTPGRRRRGAPACSTSPRPGPGTPSCSPRPPTLRENRPTSPALVLARSSIRPDSPACSRDEVPDGLAEPRNPRRFRWSKPGRIRPSSSSLGRSGPSGPRLLLEVARDHPDEGLGAASGSRK